MTIEWLSLILGFLGGALLAGGTLGAFIFRTIQENARLRSVAEHEKEAQDIMRNAFSATAQDVLDKNSERFLQLAQEKLKQAQSENSHDLEKRQKAIADLVDPIDKKLKEMNERVEGLGKAGVSLESQLKNFAEDQKMLRQETHNLVQALRNPAARGRWGEMQLQRSLEMIGMVEGTHYVQQENVSADGTRRQPDFIVKLPGEMQIIVDVKTPVEPYWDALEAAETEAGRQQPLIFFAVKCAIT
jgi:Uncharacterized protein conserved in bacteria